MKKTGPKPPKRAIIYYYTGALLLLLFINALALPGFLTGRVEQVSYNQFVTALENQKVIAVEEDTSKGVISYKKIKTPFSHRTFSM